MCQPAILAYHTKRRNAYFIFVMDTADIVCGEIFVSYGEI